MLDIIGVLESWANEPILALIITGTGKSFCSGVALDEVGSGDWSDNPLTALCDAVENFHVPTICALNGGVYGGGTELAMACDFRIGVKGMKMFVPAVKIGVHYAPSGLARFVQKVGVQTARRIFILGERFEDQTLADIGFVDFLVAQDEFATTVDQLADKIKSGAPLAVQGMTKTLLEISKGELNTEGANQRVHQCFASDDHAEGLLALSEGRAPKFTGR